MASTIKVDTIQDQDGNNIINENANVITVGASGDTITIPAGATFDSSAATNTLPSNVVTTDGTQTLTNKSIATTQLTGTITPSDSTVSLAKLTATGTQDSTTFLRGDNTFAEAGGGAMELLHTATGSNVSSIDIDGYFTSDYDHYKLIYSVYAATSNTDTMIRIMQGGSVITASNYWFAGSAWYYDGTYSQASTAVGFNTNYIGIASSDNTADSEYPTTGEMLFSNPLSTTQNTTMTTTSIGYNSVSPASAIRSWNYAGIYISPSTATSGISFGYIGGNIYGTIRLYGMKNS
jgi:hypothetical protein